MSQPGTHKEIFLEALEVEANSAFIKIPIAPDFETRVTEYRGVVAPRRDGQVDGLGRLVVTSKKSTANPQCACSRNRLSYCDLRKA